MIKGVGVDIVKIDRVDFIIAKKVLSSDTDEFDDFADLKESGVSSVLVKILVFLIVLALIAGAVVLANFMFDLGLF